MLKIAYTQLVILMILPIAFGLYFEDVSFFNEFIYFPLISGSLALLQTFKYNHIVLIRVKYFFPIILIAFYALNMVLLQVDFLIGFIALVVVSLLLSLYKMELRYLNNQEHH